MLVMLGMAGAGKSTQCELLEKQGDYRWLSVSHLIREKNDSDLQAIIHAGRLIPDEISDNLVKDYLEKYSDDPEVLVDGFPRDTDQARWLIGFVAANPSIKLRAVVWFDVSREVAMKRLSLRSREDDVAGAIENRFNKFEAEITTIINYFSSNNVPIIKIDSNRSEEEIFSSLKDAVH